MSNELHPEYFKTHFRDSSIKLDSIREFAIITAYATTGEQWPEERNRKANEKLRKELDSLGNLLGSLTGYSPTNHEEPGWTALIDFEGACDIGLRYEQDAIYYVRDDILFVSLCNNSRHLVEVGPFSARLTVDSP